MSPTPRTGWLLGGLALTLLFLPPGLTLLLAAGLLAAAVVDARSVRTAPLLQRRLPGILSRGVPEPLRVDVRVPDRRAVTVRQPGLPDLRIEPSQGAGGLASRVVARRRGRHRLPALATRRVGPLGLGCAYHRAGGEAEVLVFPDMHTARRLVASVRRGRFREQGRLTRGPLGLGTDFEGIRDYLPDDDIRQVNWRATARLGRPMSNQWRVEQDREVVFLVDAGRLMAAPLGDLTRLDAALDAVAAVAAVADELGDRCGTVAFDARILRSLRPRRRGGEVVVRTLFDLEPSDLDSDYRMAFRQVGGSKRSFVLVLTDLLEEVAARPLAEAVPILARRHAVVVAGVTDPDLDRTVRSPPGRPLDVFRQAVALEVLEARNRVAAALRGAGAVVIEAPPRHLPAVCVDAYLRAKARARL